MFDILEREDADRLIHKAIDRHQIIYLKTETLLDSVQHADSLSAREEWTSTLRQIIDHTAESADSLHRARRAILHGNVANAD